MDLQRDEDPDALVSMPSRCGPEGFASDIELDTVGELLLQACFYLKIQRNLCLDKKFANGISLRENHIVIVVTKSEESVRRDTFSTEPLSLKLSARVSSVF